MCGNNYSRCNGCGYDGGDDDDGIAVVVGGAAAARRWRRLEYTLDKVGIALVAFSSLIFPTVFHLL